ncbi:MULTISPECIES: type II toxin-antitoxin system PemK/MazF family toxin [unclassified Pseudomonas]|uniref:type II toxin-antitoxin system PemK/MazF family toxin n=1 Tax=unclassified Pseudomonas TaxID=196821 RepID=UPI00224B7203|nr:MULTISPECIES: type II toxin-antitoxin system PemK/MazF family toxin [unclassified Pseudomonas]MCX2812738.1 type II toxin-antitoxin system PemK/MazF family toxin [Pseudomonas sp. DCB_E]MCX9142385.1 type II toxin-antitoxin system PemK/MazF family toxin [Pseudomonas sp. DCB_Q]
MALKYQPKEATVLMRDFSGFQVPEMIKVRPVVVLRKHSQNRQLVTIVPLSTTAPDHMAGHHVVLPSYLPGSALTCWAKCDMIYTVATSRLDRCRVKSRQGSGREYMTFTMRPEHFAAVRAAVGFTLGFTHPATERSVVNVTLDA